MEVPARAAGGEPGRGLRGFCRPTVLGSAVKTGWPYDETYQGGPYRRPEDELLANDAGYFEWIDAIAAQAANEPERSNVDHRER